MCSFISLKYFTFWFFCQHQFKFEYMRELDILAKQIQKKQEYELMELAARIAAERKKKFKS
jgi:hypothetical protein